MKYLQCCIDKGVTSVAWVMPHGTVLNIPSQQSTTLQDWGAGKGLVFSWLLISLSIWSVYPFLTEGTFPLLSLSLQSFGEVAVPICFVLQVYVADSFHWRPEMGAGLLAMLTPDSSFLLGLIPSSLVCIKGTPRNPNSHQNNFLIKIILMCCVVTGIKTSVVFQNQVKASYCYR